MGVPVISLG